MRICEHSCRRDVLSIKELWLIINIIKLFAPSNYDKTTKEIEGNNEQPKSKEPNPTEYPWALCLNTSPAFHLEIPYHLAVLNSKLMGDGVYFYQNNIAARNIGIFNMDLPLSENNIIRFGAPEVLSYKIQSPIGPSPLPVNYFWKQVKIKG